MNAKAKRHVRIRFSSKVEPVTVLELTVVAVGGCEHRQNQLSARNGKPRKRRIRAGIASGVFPTEESALDAALRTGKQEIDKRDIHSVIGQQIQLPYTHRHGLGHSSDEVAVDLTVNPRRCLAQRILKTASFSSSLLVHLPRLCWQAVGKRPTLS